MCVGAPCARCEPREPCELELGLRRVGQPCHQAARDNLTLHHNSKLHMQKKPVSRRRASPCHASSPTFGSARNPAAASVRIQVCCCRACHAPCCAQTEWPLTKPFDWIQCSWCARRECAGAPASCHAWAKRRARAKGLAGKGAQRRGHRPNNQQKRCTLPAPPRCELFCSQSLAVAARLVRGEAQGEKVEGGARLSRHTCCSVTLHVTTDTHIKQAQADVSTRPPLPPSP